MKTLNRIQKITSKGQITLPVSWRRATKTDLIQVSVLGNRVEVTPVLVSTKNKKNDGWVRIFDAHRDRKGKGVSLEDMISRLEKSLKKNGRTR